MEYKKLFKVCTALFASMQLISTANAVDLEVYLQHTNLPPEEVRPNVIFVLDTSGSMGRPADNATYGEDRWKEETNFNSAITYPAEQNYSGGAGDSDYFYFYEKPNSHANQYIYYNKVHKDQLKPDCTFDQNGDFIGQQHIYYEDGGTNRAMCYELGSGTCGYTSGATEDNVGCDSSTTNNELYVMSANVHNFLQSYYRYSVLQTVIRDFLDQDRDMNITLMRFNGSDGGYVIQESTLAYDEDDAAQTAINQQAITDAMDDIFKFEGTTPLTEVLWEAYRYASGKTADYGDEPGTSTPIEAYSSGTTYDSPIDYACQKTRIVLLTDGVANNDNGRNDDIESSSYYGSSCSGKCMDEFASWIYGDNSTSPPTPRDHSSLVGTQQIVVDTIGFGPGADANSLKNTADKGGGLFFSASNAAELAEAFNSLADQTEWERDTFVAPAVAVNAYSGLTHREELYFALFEPQATPQWHGNIKKYRLENGVIVDDNGNDAVDDGDTNELETGFFKASALSIWSALTDFDNDPATGNTDGEEADGAEIRWGGHAYKLDDPAGRKLYTYISNVAPDNVSINIEPVTDANTNITTDILGLGASDTFTEADRVDILNWARGYATGSDPDDNTPGFFTPDIIHNQPVVITYWTDASDPEDVEFDDTLFAASNMGLFHAIDPDDTEGGELFSFIPQELLPNLTAYYQDAGSFSDKVYGLDSPMTVWRNDVNNNGSIVTAENGEIPEVDGDGNEDHVYIYQAMRRGGKSIYALDVTKRTDPKLLWQIDGGTGGTPGFENMGQSWSTPQLSSIAYMDNTDPDDPKIVAIKVLFFGGGYDTDHDSAITPTSGDEGAALYMVNAETGELLWSVDSSVTGFSGMDNSIAATVTPADVDGNGYVDFLFAVDIQGTVWRIDFPAPADVSSVSDHIANISGGAIADLGGTGNDFRRFYNAPDVSFFSPRGKSAFLAISIASGHREDPRELILNDYLFVTFDPHALSKPSDYTYNGSSIITADNLPAIVNTNGVKTGTANEFGWKMALGESGDGEKGLTRTITFNDLILMTSYVPALNTCDGGSGSSKLYLLDALGGQTRATDDDGDIVDHKELYDGGIPPEPAVIFTSSDQCVENCKDTDDDNDVFEKRPDVIVCVGTECLDDELDLSLHKTYWREN